MMKIVFAAAEAAPFFKTGGLADVVGSLPKALLRDGVSVDVFLPLHGSIRLEHREMLTYLGATSVHLGWRIQHVGIFETTVDGIHYYFIDNEFYFRRPNLYGEGDDGERYIYFSKAVLAALKWLDLHPDILHTHDWHTAAINVLVDYYAKYDSFYSDIKTVYTIHNLAYQGVFDPYCLGDLLNLPEEEYFHEEGLKFYDNINLMKGGIIYSDHVTTVSKSYAEEIKYPFFGENLDGIIRRHEGKLTGIVNGIDYEIYNPETDVHIPVHYTASNFSRKHENKMHLQIKFGLPVDPSVPMLAIVSRLADMKGMDLLAHIFEELVQENIQFVILGTGQSRYEDMFRYFQYRYPNKVAARIYFNQAESHEIYAGADIFVMPSLFEPCGLSQLIALRYGTVPVVRQIGGLKDTVLPYNQYTGEGNGFGFVNYNAHELLFTIKEALAKYRDPNVWPYLIEHAMLADHSWKKSSLAYLDIYKKLLGRPDASK
ncbi:MAG: starch synthase [Clostridiales bacterium]|jgi:starch synthase|nr:starch synthase [Clostridiales bacterium]